MPTSQSGVCIPSTSVRCDCAACWDLKITRGTSLPRAEFIVTKCHQQSRGGVAVPWKGCRQVSPWGTFPGELPGVCDGACGIPRLLTQIPWEALRGPVTLRAENGKTGKGHHPVSPLALSPH